MRQSRLDAGLGFQVKVFKTFKLLPLGSEADQEKQRPVRFDREPSGIQRGFGLLLLSFITLKPRVE